MSVRSTERGGQARASRQPAGEEFKQFDCVRSVKETARILGIGEPSLRVMIREGRAPHVTRLSSRRIGIRDSHREAWLDAQEQQVEHPKQAAKRAKTAQAATSTGEAA